MIDRSHRFHGHNSLRGVYSRGRTIRGPLSTLKITQTKPGFGYRLAVVVSKKVNKSAVVRNRIRRRVYEIVRTSLPADEPYDMVLTVFSEQLADMPAAELKRLVQSQLKQAGVNKPTNQNQS